MAVATGANGGSNGGVLLSIALPRLLTPALTMWVEDISTRWRAPSVQPEVGAGD